MAILILFQNKGKAKPYKILCNSYTLTYLCKYVKHTLMFEHAHNGHEQNGKQPSDHYRLLRCF